MPPPSLTGPPLAGQDRERGADFAVRVVRSSLIPPIYDVTIKNFGNFLVAEGKLRQDQVDKAFELQKLVGGRVGTNLLEAGVIGEEALLAALGRFREVQTVGKLELRHVPEEVIRLVPEKFARRYRLVPVKLSGRNLLVASMDAGDPLLEDELGLLTGCLARTVVGLEVRVREALARFYGVPIEPRVAALLRRLERGGVGVDLPSPEPAAPPPSSPIPASLLEGARRASPRPASSVGPEPEPDKEFIDLDTDDLALLYGGAVPVETPPAPRPPASPPAAAAVPAVATTPAAVAPAVPAAAAVAPSQPAAPSPPPSPEGLLRTAATALQQADIRDEIADALLDFCRPLFRRALLLFLRHEKIVGWRGEGEGVLPSIVRAIEIDAKDPSVFFSLTQGASFWRGPLPALPANQSLIFGLGGAAPKECLVLPVTLRNRVVTFLYVDNLADGVGNAPMVELRRLVAKAGIAFEVYILKNKIRTT